MSVRWECRKGVKYVMLTNRVGHGVNVVLTTAGLILSMRNIARSYV